MSGTIAKVKELAQAAASKFRRLRAESARQQQLKQNREDVVAEICAMFGWQSLDPFAQTMLDKAFAGQTVDIKQLKKDLAAWKAAQEAEASATVTVEGETAG